MFNISIKRPLIKNIITIKGFFYLSCKKTTKQHFQNKSLPKRGQTLIWRIFPLYLCLVIQICCSCCCKDTEGFLHVFLPTISTILFSQIPWQTLRDKEISIQIQSPIYMLQKLKEICKNLWKTMTTTTYLGEVIRLSWY